MTEKSVMTELT